MAKIPKTRKIRTYARHGDEANKVFRVWWQAANRMKVVNWFDAWESFNVLLTIQIFILRTSHEAQKGDK